MALVNNMMKSWKKMLGITYYTNHTKSSRSVVGIMNFSATTKPPQQEDKKDEAADSILLDPKYKCIKDAAANLVAYDLLNLIGKNNNASPSPSPAINPLLQDLLDKLYDFHKKPFTSKDKFKFMFDDTGMHLTLNVSNLGKEHLRVFVTDNTLLVSSTMKVAATGKMLWEIIQLPQLCIYDPDRITGRIIEGGALKVSFPYSKEEKKHLPWFQVNLV